MLQCQAVHFHDHDYTRPPCALENYEACTVTSSAYVPEPPDLAVLEEMKQKLDFFLYSNWVSVLERDGISVLLVARDRPRVSQRSIFFHYGGAVQMSVHCYDLDSEPYVKDAPLPFPLSGETINEFVDRAVYVVGQVRLMEICAGVDNEKYECVWDYCTFGHIDRNPYRESRYTDTFRSSQCKRLVSTRTWRCAECTKLLRPLRRKLTSSQQEPKLNTPNVHLTEEQKLRKLKSQRSALDTAKQKIKLLHKKIEGLVEKEGVSIDNDIFDGLSEILKSHDIAPAQEIFLHQQVKAAQVKKKSSMRWHPTMIRFALSLHLNSPAAYEELRDTGMIKLPCRRTLFDYTHVKPLEEGIDNLVLESVIKRVATFQKYQKYHVLIADEMYISKNLVFQKSSGRMIGFTKLDEADKEVKALNAFLDLENPEKEVVDPKQEVASRVLCYMVKGTANNIKEVVASYAVTNVSSSQMYLWTWHVISALECGGIQVVAFICDGSTTNRAFINLHAPKTELASGVVMDTVNKAAPHRTLYFISDVAHLLKTIRNCFCKSRADPNKGKRCLKRRGKKIVWDYIIRLYKDTRNKSVRKSYKLSPVHVFLDSYSCMKVCYAAQVLSLTVASELKKRNYPGVSETIKFITDVNNWFDQLNGAHSTVGKKKNNPNLCPYTSVGDRRFKELQDFLDDLSDWKNEAYNQEADVTVSSTMNANILDQSTASEADISLNPIENNDEDYEDEEDTPASKRILSHQTLKGIEMTTRAFIECVKFLLNQGTHFINARVFSQDPLEQYFSKQRMGGGGSTNPNLQQFLWKNRAIHLKGQLGMKRSRGNTSEVLDCQVEVTEDRLQKRSCNRTVNCNL